MLACFDTKSLDYEEFRLVLRKVFRLEFSDEEYAEAFELFDTDKSRDIDGTEFLVYFTHLSTIWKEQQKTKHLKRKQEKEEELRAKRLAREEAQSKHMEGAVDYDYSPEDERTATEKLREGAKKYKKGHASSKSCRAFETLYLDPYVFKHLMLQTFDVNLTPKESAFLVRKYDCDSCGKVYAPTFLMEFLRLGNELRMDAWSRQVSLTRAASQELEAEHHRKIEANMASLETGFDFDFSPEDTQNALKKLNQAAVKFHRNSASSLSLDGFCSVTTTPGIFREMLKRTFNLILPRKELGALIKYFDSDDSGTVNNKEFLTYFSRASTGGRFALRSESIERQRRTNAEAEKEKEEKLAAQWGKLEDRVKYEFSEADEASARHKITELARKYFNDKPSNVGLKAFEEAVMGPARWRELMRRSFGCTISDGELAYYIREFGNEEKQIDCTGFVLKFNAMVAEQRSKARSYQLKLESDEIQRKRSEEEARMRAYMQKNEKSVAYDYSDADIESMLAKFRSAAIKHDKSHPAAVSLEAFEVSKMPAIDFQELCRRVFRLDLTARELGAVVTLCRGGFKDSTSICAGSVSGSLEGMPLASLGSKAVSSSRIFNSEDSVDGILLAPSTDTLLSPADSNAEGFFKNDDSLEAVDANNAVVDAPSRPVSRLDSSRGLVSRQGSLTRQESRSDTATESIVNCKEFMLIFSQLQRMEKGQMRSYNVNLMRRVKKRHADEQAALFEKARQHERDLVKFQEADKTTLMQKLNKAAQVFAIDK